MSRRTKSALTWEEAVDAFLAHLEARRASPRTLYDRRRQLANLETHLDPLRLDQVRLCDLRGYQVGLLSGATAPRRQPLSAGAVANVSSAVRGFFAFLCEEGHLREDPARRLERPRLVERPPQDALKVDEVERLLAAAEGTTPVGLRDRALVEVLYAAGLRRAEALALDVHDLCRRERDLTVRHGKGDRARSVPLTRSAFHQLTAYLERGRPALVSAHADSLGALFLSTRGRRLDRATIRQVLLRLGQAARIGRAVRPHMLRRSFATHLLQSGASLRHIQLLLGHEHLDTTAVYLRLDPRELRTELLLRHPRERLDV